MAVPLADAIQEPGHGFALPTRFELGLPALLDDAQIGFETVDIVEESTLAVEELSTDAFERLASDEEVHGSSDLALPRLEPEPLEALGQLAEDVPGFALEPARVAQNLLEGPEDDLHRLLRCPAVPEAGARADVSQEFRRLGGRHGPVRTIALCPQRPQRARQLSRHVGGLLRRQPVAQLLEDGEGHLLGAHHVASELTGHLPEECGVVHEALICKTIAVGSGAPYRGLFRRLGTM